MVASEVWSRPATNATAPLNRKTPLPSSFFHNGDLLVLGKPVYRYCGLGQHLIADAIDHLFHIVREFFGVAFEVFFTFRLIRQRSNAQLFGQAVHQLLAVGVVVVDAEHSDGSPSWFLMNRAKQSS